MKSGEARSRRRYRFIRWLPAAVVLAGTVAILLMVALNHVADQLGEAGGMAGVDSGDTSISWDPDGRHIVVARGQEGIQTLFELDADGSDPHRLISSSAADIDAPAVSPDGGRIAFVRLADEIDLYTAAADGSHVKVLTSTEDAEGEPSWSPDGREIAFVRGSDLDFESDLYTMRANGTHVRRLTRGDDLEDDPAWSPDGEQIAFVAYPGVYVVPARRPGKRRLVSRGLAAPTWSPDGRRLAFVEDRATIEIVGLATGKARRLVVEAEVGTDDVRTAPDDLAWSPDGRMLAYTVGGSLYAMNLGTGKVRRLTHCVDGGNAGCGSRS